ncbi:AsmA family protein [Flavihumibacter petaseus]|uniref:AsmA domain-containing protein n=1 Tax=Flavihumibacter petaseus NBRC 106054 TaxID=1220578 RepID=A0A0E9N3Y3_9BACT|nr:AsmA-like C-terminal region-containing protein [Flavihumibacter petaseus]GAO44366.1 hypothetical protein FPE01S_03_04040 [Flavihumibacter petaseus NBRC 106054]
MMKKVLTTLGIILLVLFVLAFAAPLLFGGKLKAIAKKEMNEKIRGKSGFSDVSISLFRHFPRVSVGLDGLYMTGPENFPGDTLLSANRIDVAVNLMSLFGSGPIEISHVTLEQPRIHAIVLKDGQANWDIMKPDEDTTAASEPGKGFSMDLKKYSIRDGYIRYDDEQGNMHLLINQLDHEGSGNFSSENFILKTQTNAVRINFSMEGIPYLVDTQTDLAADFDITASQSLYKFSHAALKLNELAVNADGFFQLVNDSTYKMDITFKTPSNEFKSLLSLVPSVYRKDFNELKTKGTAAFEGWVKGTYSGNQLPAFEVKAKVKDGFFQYPDLPQPVQDINLQLTASNPDGVIDHTVVDIPQANLKFGAEPFQFRLLLKNPESVRYIDAAAKGKLDLGTIGQFIKLAEGTRIGGQVTADLSAKGNLEVVMQQKPGPFQAQGMLQLANVSYAAKDFPQPIQKTNALIEITNPDGLPDHTIVRIPAGHVELGSDAVDFTLLLTQPASDPTFDAGLKGGLQLDRVKQFYTFEPGTSLEGKLLADVRFAGKKSMIDRKAYDQVKASGSINLSDLIYKSLAYPDGMQVKKADLVFTPASVSLPAASGKMMGTNFTVSGKLDNAIGYALKDEPLAGTLQFNADKIDLNKWMGQPSTGDKQDPKATENDSATSSIPFAVPANLNLTLQSAIGQLVYDKINYNNVKGNVRVANETVTLDNLSMDALDGNIRLAGHYSTKENKLKPEIGFEYQLNGLDIGKTFSSFNTVKYLMPVAGFITGKLQSGLSLSGKMSPSMMPDPASLAGKGNIVVDGILSKFKPFETLAQQLQIKGLDQIELKGIKQSFEFIKGKVMVKPFHVKWQDIDMEIGGMHGFDQSLDYIINMKVPRERFGSDANKLLNNMVTSLNSKGIPANLGETVNLKVNLGGTLQQPQLKYDLQQQGTSLAAEVKGKADSLVNAAKKEAQDSLESVKKQAVKDLESIIKEQVSGKKDTSATGKDAGSTTKKAEEAAKGLLNNILKKKKNAADSTQKKQ